MSSLIESKVSAIKLKRKIELKFVRVLRQDLFPGVPSFTPVSAAHTPAHILTVYLGSNSSGKEYVVK